MSRIKDIESRLSAIKEELDNPKLDLKAIEGLSKEVDALMEERDAIIKAGEERLSHLRAIANGEGTVIARHSSDGEDNFSDTVPLLEGVGIATGKSNRGVNKKMERGFGKQLMEKRSVITSSSLVIPQLEQNYIEKKYSEVSGILDLVRFMHIGQGNKYTVPYSNTVATGGITAEGSNYTEAEPTFDEVEINGIKITAYTQYNEEVEKLPSADYEAFIANEIRNAINRKVIEQIVNGNGVSQFKGLYDTSIVQASSDISISAIDEDTLDNIVYGLNTSAEEVEGNLVLLLNKKDLGAFAKVRTTDGQKVYDISFNSTGQAGTINGVKFCICNSLKALSDSSVEADSYTMCYVNPNKYVIPVFSGFELMKDYSAGFIQGKITVKGSMILGGAPSTPFMGARIKKVAAS